MLYEHYRRVRKDLERLDFGSQSVAELGSTTNLEQWAARIKAIVGAQR